MVSSEAILESHPAELCGCRVDRSLSDDDNSFLACGVGNRLIVLKRLDSDCLHHETLHPSVRDRLSRVRELAHAGVANLFGVERDDAGVYLMWEYVEGHPFPLYVGANRTPREVALLARELVLAVDLLHMQGIVHGALIGNNVIVSSAGVVRLTHISPLLYTDPSVDIECIWNLLEEAADSLGDRATALSGVIAESRRSGASLRQLASNLSALIDVREGKKAARSDAEVDAGPRRRAYVGAAVVAILGVACAWGARRAIESNSAGLSQNVHLSAHANDR